MKFILFIISLTIFSSYTHAQDCRYEADAGTFSAPLINSTQIIEHVFSVRRNRLISLQCSNYRAYFGTGSSNSYDRKAFNGQNSLSYNLYRTIGLGDVLKDFPDAGPGEFISGNLPMPFNDDSKSFYVSLPDTMSIFELPAGVYTDIVPINFYSLRQNGSLQYQITRFLTISIEIPRFIELSLVPENAPHDSNSTSYLMDFGTMSSNQELAADLRVVGNLGYEVMMSSMNGGLLLNNPDSVSYQLKVGQGSYLSLSPAGSVHQVAQSQTGTNLDGQRFNLRVKLGEVAQTLRSGDYQDVITITIQAW